MHPTSSLSTSRYLAAWPEKPSSETPKVKEELTKAVDNFFTAKGTKELAATMKSHFPSRNTPFTETELEMWYKESTGKITTALINPDIGSGVFATALIGESCPISCYGGVLRPSHSAARREYRWEIDWVGGKKDTPQRVLIDGYSKDRSNFTRSINGVKDKEDANVDAIYIPVTTKGGEKSIQVLYIANKPITPGQQLLVDYGEYYDWGGIDPERVDPDSFTLVDDGTGSFKVACSSSASQSSNTEEVEQLDKETEEENDVDSSESEIPAILRPQAPSVKLINPGKNKRLQNAREKFEENLNKILPEDEDLKAELKQAMEKFINQGNHKKNKQNASKIIIKIRGYHPESEGLLKCVKEYMENLVLAENPVPATNNSAAPTLPLTSVSDSDDDIDLGAIPPPPVFVPCSLGDTIEEPAGIASPPSVLPPMSFSSSSSSSSSFAANAPVPDLGKPKAKRPAKKRMERSRIGKIILKHFNQPESLIPNSERDNRSPFHNFFNSYDCLQKAFTWRPGESNSKSPTDCAETFAQRFLELAEGYTDDIASNALTAIGDYHLMRGPEKGTRVKDLIRVYEAFTEELLKAKKESLDSLPRSKIVRLFPPPAPMQVEPPAPQLSPFSSTQGEKRKTPPEEISEPVSKRTKLNEEEEE